MSSVANYSKNARASKHGSLNVSRRSIPELINIVNAKHRPRLLKIDCEGCEYEVLPQLEQLNMLHAFSRIVGEIHAPPAPLGRSPKSRLYEQLKRDFCVRVEEVTGKFV